MYIRELHIDGLKLLRNFELSFTRDGEPRMWTVLVGRNGLCKTSILRAIALAASGRDLANELSSGMRPSLRDCRRQDPLTIQAEFDFGPVGYAEGRTLPHFEMARPILDSHLELLPAERAFSSHSSWQERPPTAHEVHVSYAEQAEAQAWHRGHAKEGSESPPEGDSAEFEEFVLPSPLDTARSQSLPHWFVAGYGVNRNVPLPFDASHSKRDPLLARVSSLFDGSPLIATGFSEKFRGAELEVYSRLLDLVMANNEGLIPGVRGVSLSNGGATRSSDVDMAHRLRMRTGAHDVEVPSTWLSHGYQATVSWLADLVGHVLWERSENNLELTADPSKMEGLVLIDELDLHLHPSWQVGLIPALKQTFPRLQFVVTTHSEMLLAGLEGDEIVMLDQDPETGDITHHSDPRPAKLMTGTEMLGRYFGIDRLYPVNLSKEAHRYGYLAGDPYRTDEEQAELDELRRRLESAGVAPDWDPVPRKTS